MAHFRQENVDVILCPFSASPAPPHETAHYWPYTSIFNLVDYPGAVFPTGIVVEEQDAEPARKYRNASDEENARNCERTGGILAEPTSRLTLHCANR